MKKLEYVKMKDVSQAMMDTFDEATLPYDPAACFAHLTRLLNDLPTVKMGEDATAGTVEVSQSR